MGSRVVPVGWWVKRDRITTPLAGHGRRLDVNSQTIENIATYDEVVDNLGSTEDVCFQLGNATVAVELR
jgi:hypothetical protein